MGRKGERLPGEALTVDECRALLAACGDAVRGRRDRAVIVLLWRAGLRCFEALALRARDLDLENGLVRVRRGKNGKPRVVGLDPAACAIVASWLDLRAAMALGAELEDPPVLCSLRSGGRALTTGYVRGMVAARARAARIPHRVHPHALRHSWAVQALEEGLTLPQVQAQLGHADLSTTGAYLRHIAPHTLAERARARPSWEL